MGINVEVPTLKAFIRLECFLKEKEKVIITMIIFQKKVPTKILRGTQYQNKEQSFKRKKKRKKIMALLKIHHIILISLTSEQTAEVKSLSN